MDLALEPIAARPIDYAIVQAAGAPGSMQRIMVMMALGIISRPNFYKAGGRGPTYYDWLGVVMECVHETRWACMSEATTPDIDLPGDAPSVAQVGFLFQSWGMKEITFSAARPGDVVLFSRPAPLAGVVTVQNLMVAVMDGRPPAIHVIGPHLLVSGYRAYTWERR